jgi:hypothetical protein
MRAYIQRDYSKVVFFELVVQSLDGCRHFSVDSGELQSYVEDNAATVAAEEAAAEEEEAEDDDDE